MTAAPPPLSDRELDRLLAQAAVPERSADLTARIIAEAARAGRPPRTAPPPVPPRARRRPWTRRTLIASVVAINLLAASAIAAAFGGHGGFGRLSVLSAQIVHTIAAALPHRHPTPHPPVQVVRRRVAPPPAAAAVIAGPVAVVRPIQPIRTAHALGAGAVPRAIARDRVHPVAIRLSPVRDAPRHIGRPPAGTHADRRPGGDRPVRARSIDRPARSARSLVRDQERMAPASSPLTVARPTEPFAAGGAREAMLPAPAAERQELDRTRPQAGAADRPGLRNGAGQGGQRGWRRRAAAGQGGRAGAFRARRWRR